MRGFLCFGVSLLLCCGAEEARQPEHAHGTSAQQGQSPNWKVEKPWSNQWLEGQAQRYLGDANFRLEILVASLTNAKNIYSHSRISAYGIAAAGWDQLPSWNPKTAAVDSRLVDSLQKGEELTLPDALDVLWDGEVPKKMQDWVRLGRKVFYRYPLRSEIFAEHALRSTTLAKRVGLQSSDTGQYPGVIAFMDIDGDAEIGITCALCHVDFEEGKVIEGRARRSLDYGEMRLAYYRDTGTYIDPIIAERMARWGPGRADITQDDDEDPVAIVDLWGIRSQEYLTQAGTIRHLHPAALAIRQETQLLHANEERIRPPRVLAWALAMYVYSLTPPKRSSGSAQGDTELGKTLFDEHCAYCHRDEAYGGLPVSAQSVGTDPTLADGEARGTGLYRPSPLLRVADAAPYFHDGSVETLRDVLNAGRKVPGHRYGVELNAKSKEALLAFLNTL